MNASVRPAKATEKRHLIYASASFRYNNNREIQEARLRNITAGAALINRTVQ